MIVTQQSRGGKQLEIGERGDYLLVEEFGWFLGILEDVVNDLNNVPFLKFRDLHKLTNYYFGNIRFPQWAKNRRYTILLREEPFSGNPQGSSRPGKREIWSESEHYVPVNAIENVVVGLDNIMFYLDAHPRYGDHAESIRKIAHVEALRTKK